MRRVTHHFGESVAEGYSATLESLANHFCPPWELTDWSQGRLRWRLLRPAHCALPQQGWKIHVSAAAVEAADVCALVAARLFDFQAAFKLPRTLDDVVFINSGDAGAALMGKIVTIYPGDADRAAEIATSIDRVWPVSRGPEVASDLHLRPGSAVSFRFGVFGTAPVLTSSSGIHEFALIAPDGCLVPDARDNGEPAPWAPAPPLPCCPPREHPVTLQQVLSLDGARYVPVAVISDKPTARIFLAVGVDPLATVIVKVARPGAAGDVRGRDATDSLKKEARILAELSAVEGLAPRILRSHDGEWPVAVLEDFRGDLLSDLDRQTRIECLLPLAKAIAALHGAGFVHCDIKLENAVRRGGRVGLLDFELAERDGEPVRAGGTRGHLPPETSEGTPAAFSRDVFALGGCVAHAVLGMPPALVPGGPERLEGLLRLEGVHVAAALVRQFCHADPARRPTASEAAAAIATEQDHFRQSAPAAGAVASARELNWCRRASLEAASLVERYIERDADGPCWRNEHFMTAFRCEGINIGAAGIVIGLTSIDQALGRRDFDEPVRLGAAWLAARTGDGKSAGLFTGNAGVAVALALAGRRLSQPEYVTEALDRLRRAALDDRESDLFSGSAGVVVASCLISDILEDESALEWGEGAVRVLERRFASAQQIPVWPVDAESDLHHLGCAHGSAGIAMALACWARKGRDRRLMDTAIDTFRRIFEAGRTEDGRALRMSLESNRAHASGTWCHGAAGYLWAMVHTLGDEPSLRREIDWAVGAVHDAMAVGTPTYCHGLAGQLELWRMLSAIPRFGQSAAAQAGKTVRALRVMHQKVNGSIAWCSDDPAITTPDLWIGFLGPATALALHAFGTTAPLLSGEWLRACAHPGSV